MKVYHPAILLLAPLMTNPSLGDLWSRGATLLPITGWNALRVTNTTTPGAYHNPVTGQRVKNEFLF